MLSKEHFLATYRELESEDLLGLIATRQLTEDAGDSAIMVLLERGIVGDRLELEYAAALKGFTRRAGVTNQCDYCGQSILLGAFHDEGQRFCGPKCRDQARLQEASFDLAPDLVLELAHAIFIGPCPRCGRRGKPVEMRPRWLVASSISRMVEKTEHELCCRRCAQRRNWWAIASCLVFGWWSLSGLFATPAAIYRNIVEIYAKRVRTGPSRELLERARLNLAERMMGPMEQATAFKHAIKSA